MQPHARSAVLVLVVLALAAAPARGALTRGDSEFDLAGYDVVEVETGNVTPLPEPDGLGTVTVTREPSGGASGAFARIRLQFNSTVGASGYGGLFAVVLRTELIDPAAEGGFASARHFEWARQLASGGDGHATGIAIRQGDSIYVARVECTPDPEWTFKCSAVEQTSCVSGIPAINPVLPESFVRIAGAGPDAPDLSAAGAPFQLGFYRAASGPAGSPAAERIADIDDWKVVLLPPCTVDADCAEDDACVSDVCTEGVCMGTCVACVDGNPCTQDGCDPATGTCPYPPVADGTACGDEDVCNGDETCQAGACVSPGPPNCDDGNDCTVDECSFFGGCVSHDAASFEAALAKVQDFLTLIGGPVCNDQPLVKKLKKKVKKKAAKVRKLVARADRATKIALVNQLVAKADDLLDAVRGLLGGAVTNGELTAECAAQIAAFLDDVQACVASVPRGP